MILQGLVVSEGSLYENVDALLSLDDAQTGIGTSGGII